MVEFAHTNAELNANLLLYGRLKRIHDICEGVEKACNIAMPKIADRANKVMLAESVDSCSVGGFNFSPSSKTMVSVTKANKESLLEWMRNDEEGKELIKEDVHFKTLESFVKARMEAGKEVPFVTVFDQPALTVRKAKNG